jgi:hypothetical protein
MAPATRGAETLRLRGNRCKRSKIRVKTGKFARETCQKPAKNLPGTCQNLPGISGLFLVKSTT